MCFPADEAEPCVSVCWLVVAMPGESPCAEEVGGFEDVFECKVV